MSEDAVRSTDRSMTDAVDAIRRGESVVVVDDESPTSQGVLVMAAETASSDKVAVMVRHTSGVVCVALTGERCDALGLPLMVAADTEYRRAAFTHSVDLRHGTTTGISASDRALTIRALADPAASWSDFNRPGHVFPLRARDGGVLKWAGRPEAAVDLVRLAGLEPVAVLCGMVSADGSMATRGELEPFVAEHGLTMISIPELVTFRQSHEKLVVPVGDGRVPTSRGLFVAHAYRSELGRAEHVAFVVGSVAGPDPVPVSVHIECPLGDIFGSSLCGCGSLLDDALDHVARAGAGVVVYLRGEEGRGTAFDHGQSEDGRTDAESPEAWRRRYTLASQILEDLGVQRVRLLVDEGAEPALWTGGPTVVERIRPTGRGRH